jgi:signal transduction histidine kinase
MSAPPPPDGSAPVAAAGAHTLVLRGNLQRDLFRLGVVPCAAVALALTGWFTHNRLQTLEAAFDAEGQAVARQVAAMSDLSLYAGDLPALQNVANAALRGGQVARVEISNSAGVYVTAGPKTTSLAQLRMFTSPVTLREASRASAFAPAGSTAAGETPIGLVQTFRDTTAYARERSRSLFAGVGIALVALLAAWASVRHMARNVARPLRRVSRTVAALEAGHFDVRCGVVEGGTRGTHELAVLAHDIDRLAERLQSNREISEERVREATAVALQRMAEAEQAALSRARFLAAASHDLRQPLHAMGLFIDGLLPGASPTQRPAVLRLQESTEFMGVLLDDLLEISRLDAQVLTPAITNVSLAALFDQLDAQHAATAADARVRLRWSDRGLAVRTDAAMLQRIVGNLVANALRHAPEGGSVLVAAQAAQAAQAARAARATRKATRRSCASRCATTAWASRPSTRAASSKSSTRWPTPSATAAGASAWAWPSARASRRCWARASPCARRCRPAAPSPSRCPRRAPPTSRRQRRRPWPWPRWPGCAAWWWTTTPPSSTAAARCWSNGAARPSA